MGKPISSLYSSVQKFVDALHQYQTAVVEINRATHRQIEANRLIGNNLKSIAETFRV